MKRLFLFPLVFLVATFSLAGVSVDHDAEVDFSGLKTFAWMEGTPAGSDLVQRRIHSASQRELEAQGWSLSDSPADVYVVTHASVAGRTRVHVDNFGYRGYWRGYGASTVHVQEIKVGTLIVDMLDGDSTRLIWRAVATQTLPTNPKPAKIEKKINKVVGKMFRKFPPSVEK